MTSPVGQPVPAEPAEKRFVVRRHQGFGWMVYMGDEPVGRPMYGPYYSRRANALEAADALEASESEDGPLW